MTLKHTCFECQGQDLQQLCSENMFFIEIGDKEKITGSKKNPNLGRIHMLNMPFCHLYLKMCNNGQLCQSLGSTTHVKTVLGLNNYT